MTNYQLTIKDSDLKAHLDLEDEIQLKKDGVFTFTIRINNDNIVDLNVTEYVSIKERYAIVKTLVIEEVTAQRPVASNSSQRSETNPVRSDNLHSPTKGRSGPDWNFKCS